MVMVEVTVVVIVMAIAVAVMVVAMAIGDGDGYGDGNGDADGGGGDDVCSDDAFSTYSLQRGRFIVILLLFPSRNHCKKYTIGYQKRKSMSGLEPGIQRK